MANKTIDQLTAKANPVDADLLVIADSQDNNEMKQITISSITADIGDGLIVDGSSSLTTTYSSTKIAADNATQDAALTAGLALKLNRNNQLRTGNGAWKVSHTNGSGNEVELALGTAGQVLTSSGATSAPTFATPTADINGLTEDTTGSMANDFLLAYDASAAANRKQKPQVYSATNAEAAAKSSTTKFTTPANLALIAPNNQKFQTYAFSALPTTFSVAHGLSIAPSFVRVKTFLFNVPISASTYSLGGEGTYKSGTYSTWYVTTTTGNPPTSSGVTTTASTISQLQWENNGTADDLSYTMTISSIDATNINFAITRTLGGSVSGNVLFIVEFEI